MHTAHGTIQGYNGQALVDKKHQVIMHAEAFGCGQDHGHLEPMLNGAKKNLQEIGHSQDYFKGKILTADTNYHSHDNIKNVLTRNWMPIFLILNFVQEILDLILKRDINNRQKGLLS